MPLEIRNVLFALSLVLLTSPSFAMGDESLTIHRALDHYEVIRTSLVDDTLDHTAEAAEAIEEILAALHRDLDLEAAAVASESRDRARDLLAQMHGAATGLTQATGDKDLTATRDAFYELSKPMVQYRELMTGERPVVAYCPMERKSWLQQEDAIGNPYAGQSMPSCGSVVSNGG
ncbi:MAG: hypothetical protein MPN21_12905 [Thermoanaerobaculia bacterium]|nr:hypothetical protein [Thermoanaerobaculia bacterium]